MTDTIKELLLTYKTIIILPIQWGDMDAANHVNNVMYARYSESARIAYLEELEKGKPLNFSTDIGPILAELNIQYKIPLAYPDIMYLGTKVIALPDEYSYVMETIIISKFHQKTACKITARMVSYDYSKKQKAPIPDWMRKKIEEKEAL
jgi:acyl-CoA thioester hydrolase